MSTTEQRKRFLYQILIKSTLNTKTCYSFTGRLEQNSNSTGINLLFSPHQATMPCLVKCTPHMHSEDHHSRIQKNSVIFDTVLTCRG